MNETRICSVCGAILTEHSAYELDDEVMCEQCYSDRTVNCDCCGERIWRNSAEICGNHYICSSCYDDHYTSCEDCGRVIHRDDACYVDDSDYPYCSTCYHKLQDTPIKPYGYKPSPIFYGDGNLFMGVELEIDGAGEEDCNADEILSIGNKDADHIYCKHDGSLDEGFEIVSHPMTLDYHLHKMNWKEVMSRAVDMNYASHNTDSCGLHIHCGRSSFGETIEEQEAAIGRVVYFVEKHWDELVNFSRRTPSNLNRWAARYATLSNSAEITYKSAKEKFMGRYVAVNLTNYNTIEFRMFRGTLRYKTFAATLQLVQHICILAVLLSDKDFENMSWSKFVLSIDSEDTELIEYLKLRRLYVNEATTNGSEEY